MNIQMFLKLYTFFTVIKELNTIVSVHMFINKMEKCPNETRETTII